MNRSDLKLYRKKRSFDKTIEPKGEKQKNKPSDTPLTFVIQKHAARRLHYDLRLELDGVLKSWAVPKGPSLDPKVKRLAIEVEDHPYDYGSFEGTIPEGEYGAGQVIVWDNGVYASEGNTRKEQEKYIREHLAKGELHFFLYGKKLRGEFVLIRLKNEESKKEWLLFKKKDEFASQADVTEQTESVLSEKTISIDLHSVPKGSMPHKIKPMLATLVEEPFSDKEWLYEIKWDGYRAIAEVSKGKVSLYSRNFLNFNEHFPSVVKDLKKLKGDLVLDGEIVVLDSKGCPKFQLLQNYLNTGGGQGTPRYCIFDILFYRGHDLRKLPLLERKQILKEVLKEITGSYLTYSDYVIETGIELFKEATKNELEGIMAKDGRSPYLSSRSALWQKIKVHMRQEVVIVGFTEPRGGRKYIGALIVGIYINSVLTYAGHVGGGFTQDSLEELYQQLTPLIEKKCPFKKIPKTNMKPTWVKPKLVCDVSFQEWTEEGIMRQPIFQGMRLDKKPTEVSKEAPVKVKTRAKKTKSTLQPISRTQEVPQEIGTHLDKVFWPDEGYTKGDLLNYYQQVSSVIIPHLKNRPLMLHRYPNGIMGGDFFQKNAPEHLPDWVEKAVIKHSEKIISYLMIQNLDSLLYVINLGTIELHPFLSQIQSLDDPDFLVLDLDPVDLSFDALVEVARETHKILDKLGLEHGVKTSGKRGIHLYIPLHGKYHYEDIEKFAKVLAQFIHQEIPEMTSIIRNPKDRKNKVYIDYLQNDRTKSVIAPYSVRGISGATVSTPLEWKEVRKGLDPHQFTIKTVPERIKRKGDLFQRVLGIPVDLISSLNKIEKLSN